MSCRDTEDPTKSQPEEDSEAGVYCWWRSVEEKLKCSLGRTLLTSHKGGTDATDGGARARVLREMERLALVAPDGLDELRHKLLSYRPADFWVPTGGIKKEDLDVPPIITILLVGFSRSGKSSLINLMYCVLGRAGLIPFAQTAGNSSDYETMFLEEHNVLRSMRNGFCVYDSRGLAYDQRHISMDHLCQWMEDGVHHRLLCLRDCDYESSEGGIPSLRVPSSKFARRRVNCAIVVVDMHHVYKSFLAGDSKALEATKELFSSPSLRQCNENPILILTHGDLLTADERIDGRIKICQFLGISEMTGVYDIPCVTEQGFLAEEADPVSAYALTEALYRSLLFADRSHPPHRNWKDRILEFLSLIMYCISAFFALLAHWLSKLARKKKPKRL